MPTHLSRSMLWVTGVLMLGCASLWPPGGAVATAPALEGTWLQGDVVDLTTDERVVLVDLWATWCGPCIQSMPHLNAIQDRYGTDLVVVGVTEEDVGTVRPSVQRHQPEYTILADAANTFGAYQQISQEYSIPYVFLVQHGQVTWHGRSPPSMVIEESIAGRWSAERGQQLAELSALVPRYLEQARAGDAAAARATGARMLEEGGPLLHSELNEVSWSILTELPEEAQDLSFALQAVDMALEAEPDDAAYLDTRGLALFQLGRIDEAVQTQAQALARCTETLPASACAEFEQRLTEFQAAR